MEDLQELWRESVRDILYFADCVEAGPADPECVTDKEEDFIEAVGLISALTNQDIDNSVRDFEENTPSLAEEKKCLSIA